MESDIQKGGMQSLHLKDVSVSTNVLKTNRSIFQVVAQSIISQKKNPISLSKSNDSFSPREQLHADFEKNCLKVKGYEASF